MLKSVRAFLVLCTLYIYSILILELTNFNKLKILAELLVLIVLLIVLLTDLNSSKLTLNCFY